MKSQVANFNTCCKCTEYERWLDSSKTTVTPRIYNID